MPLLYAAFFFTFFTLQSVAWIFFHYEGACFFLCSCGIFFCICLFKHPQWLLKMLASSSDFSPYLSQLLETQKPFRSPLSIYVTHQHHGDAFFFHATSLSGKSVLIFQQAFLLRTTEAEIISLLEKAQTRKKALPSSYCSLVLFFRFWMSTLPWFFFPEGPPKNPYPDFF